MNAGIGARIPRAARWAMVAVTVAYILPAPLTTSFGVKDYPASGPAAVAIPLGLAIIALQLRHSFAAIRGELPRGAYLSLLALVVLTYLPLRWFWYGEWLGVQVAVIASASMLLPRWPATAVFAAVVIGTDVVDVQSLSGQPLGTVLNWVGLDTMAWFLGWLAVYGCVPLVRLVDELRLARTELAELAIGRERLRVSRDLHDLLGQSLSAVSLKSDLAIRQLRTNPLLARAEIESLTGVAREARRGVNALTRDEHIVSLMAEVEGAAALLASADIETSVDLRVGRLESPQERLLAWSVREGVTNVLRHSQATTCTIVGRLQNGLIHLEIENDGVSQPMAEASGLTGLMERAQALSGAVSAGPAAGGRFRLRVEVPNERRAPAEALAWRG
jgi:two-component system sensor histidine kinase DesK